MDNSSDERIELVFRMGVPDRELQELLAEPLPQWAPAVIHEARAYLESQPPHDERMWRFARAALDEWASWRTIEHEAERIALQLVRAQEEIAALNRELARLKGGA